MHSYRESWGTNFGLSCDSYPYCGEPDASLGESDSIWGESEASWCESGPGYFRVHNRGCVRTFTSSIIPDSSPNEIRKEVEQMSFMYLHSFRDGAVLAADSRATQESNGAFAYHNEQKVFLLPERNVAISVVGGLEFSGNFYPLTNLIAQLHGKTRYEVACELFELLKIYSPILPTTIWITEALQVGNSCVTYCSCLDIDSLSNLSRWRLVDFQQLPGNCSFAGAAWAQAYTKTARLPAITLEQGIPIVRQFMENIRDVDQQLLYGKHSIGGEIKCVALTPGKVEFV